MQQESNELIAISDLAERLGVAHTEISIVASEEVTWPDSSAGCPQPGMMYLQVLTNGYLIELTVEGVSHWYVGKAGTPPRYCREPSSPATEGRFGDF